MLIKRRITVKAVVTDQLKRRLAAEIQEAMRRLDGEIEGIGRQLKRLEREGGDARALEQCRQQREARIRKKASLLEQLKQLPQLPNGQEIVQGSVEGLVEVRMGDRWDDIQGAEIVLRDGRVVALRDPLREGGKPSDRQ